MLSWLTFVGFGLLLGLRHATDADHVLALAGAASVVFGLFLIVQMSSAGSALASSRAAPTSSRGVAH